MKKIIVDEALLSRLEGIEEDFELCDADGTVRAVVKRKISPQEWAAIEASISQEELDRRINSPTKGHSTREVLQRLEQL